MTALLALILGAVAALLALPWYFDTRIIRNMDDANPKVRMNAVYRAVERAKGRPIMVERMLAAMPEASDRQFAALVRALEVMGKSDLLADDPSMLDRRSAYEVRYNLSPVARWVFLTELITGGRSNRYVQQAMVAAAADADPDVRVAAGVLAARLGDDKSLSKLIADQDPNVAQAALIDAGIGGRTALLPDVQAMLEKELASDTIGDANEVMLASSSGFALAALDPNAAGAKLPALLAKAVDANAPALRDRVLCVMGGLDDANTAKCILDILVTAEQNGGYPPAAALEAAGRRKLTAAAPAIRRVLVDSIKTPKGLLVRQVHAAILAATRLNMPVRKAVEDICQHFWTTQPGFRLMLTDAARLLGSQVTASQGDEPDVPSPSKCIKTLQKATAFDYVPTTWPASQPEPKAQRTPLPSAAAAVALWELSATDPNDGYILADQFIRLPAWDYISLAGDYVAWNIGISRSDRAFKLGLALLPPLNAPQFERVYSDDARSTGALLLAISASTPQQKKTAEDRIRSRLEMEDSFYVKGAYQCALTILGDPKAARAVYELLQTAAFSQRRAITALTLASDLRGLDWLLWNRQINTGSMLLWLVDDRLDNVLAGCLPELPRISPAGSSDLADWQLLILRHAYGIRRASLKPHLLK